MTLEEIRRLIIASDDTGWLVIQGPTHLDRFGEANVRREETGLMEHRLEHASHYARAVLRSDVSIGLAWGLPAGMADEGYSEAWTAVFADKKAYPMYIDALLHGAIVDRTRLIAVDGGRYKLVEPELDTEDVVADKPVLMGYYIDEWQHALGRLATAFDGSGDYESALARAGIDVRRGEL